MNNLKGLMKQRTLGGGVQAKPAPGTSSFMNRPDSSASGGLLKKKKAFGKAPAMPNLMKRLTGQ